MPEEVGGLGNQPLWSKQLTRSARDMISFGAVKHWQHVGVRCDNPSVGTTTEDIWGAGGVMVWPTSAAALSVVSTSTDDDAGGTGALTVLVQGLDTNYKPVSDTVVLDGTTPVVTTQTYLRVNSAQVQTAGTGLVNAGDITVSVGGNVQRFIEADAGICHCSQYCIPAGHTGFLTYVGTWQGKDTGVEVRFTWKDFTTQVWKALMSQFTYRNTTEVDLAGSVQLKEKTDVRLQATADANTAEQAAYYVIYLWDHEGQG